MNRDIKESFDPYIDDVILPGLRMFIYFYYFKDVVRYPHGQLGVPSPGGPSCLAHARESLG